jgi:hypothetical protein
MRWPAPLLYVNLAECEWPRRSPPSDLAVQVFSWPSTTINALLARIADRVAREALGLDERDLLASLD